MSRYWFRPHTYGYGATPANWKGWLAVAVFALAVGLLAALFTLASGGRPTPAMTLAWSMGVCVLAAGFVLLARAKTDGQWRWRWGK
jgi:hypothetical protein